MRTAAAFGIAIALVSPVVLWAVSPNEKAADAASLKYYSVTYNVADLPVWRIKGKAAPDFAPDLLTKYLRKTIDPKSWSNGAEIRPQAAQASLVISQTRANHKSISHAIDSFREDHAGEFREVGLAVPPVNVGDFVPLFPRPDR
jgi:hypothetical protein